MNQKTKKIILLISTILTLIITIGYIFAISTGALELSSVDDTVQISYESQLIFLFICAFVNIISIIFIAKDIRTKSKRKKGIACFRGYNKT